jgi:hypothetical protein
MAPLGGGLDVLFVGLSVLAFFVLVGVVQEDRVRGLSVAPSYVDRTAVRAHHYRDPVQRAFV